MNFSIFCLISKDSNVSSISRRRKYSSFKVESLEGKSGAYFSCMEMFSSICNSCFLIKLSVPGIQRNLAKGIRKSHKIDRWTIPRAAIAKIFLKVDGILFRIQKVHFLQILLTAVTLGGRDILDVSCPANKAANAVIGTA